MQEKIEQNKAGIEFEAEREDINPKNWDNPELWIKGENKNITYRFTGNAKTGDFTVKYEKEKHYSFNEPDRITIKKFCIKDGFSHDEPLKIWAFDFDGNFLEKWEYEYDKNGNETRETIFDKDNKPKSEWFSETVEATGDGGDTVKSRHEGYRPVKIK